MITQQIKLNLIPGQVLPRVNASQYDNGTRTLQMALYNGDQVFNIASGMTAFVQGTKPDKTGFQYAATITEGSNIATLDITQQMTAVSGEVVCELVITSGDDRIATVNFILFVEAAALADDTVISETDLPLIEEAVEAVQRIIPIAQQVAEDAQTASNAATAATAAQAAAEEAAEEAEEWGAHPPYIGQNGNWYIYNTTTQQFEDSGVEAQGPQGETGPQGPQGVQGETGPQGPTGATGNGIVSITKTSTSGLVDTYTILFTDGTTTTFTVTNGQDGQGTGDMTKAVYDPNDAVADAGGIVAYVQAHSGAGTLAGLDDVTLSNLAAGNTLIYNATTQKWENSSAIQTLTNQVTDISDEIADMNNVLGAKNLLPNEATTQTINGVTFTVNSDGSLTVNGTATTGFNFYLNSDNNWIKTGLDFIFTTGIPYDVDAANLTIAIIETSGGSIVYKHDGDTFKFNSVPYSCAVTLWCPSGQTYNNVTFKPMIRLASIQDDTYEPYSMTNREMTPYVQAISNPNLLDNPWFTVNQRGQSSYSGAVYGVDRWLSYEANSVQTVNSEGVLVTRQIAQAIDADVISKILDKNVTISMLYNNGKILKATGKIHSDASSIVDIGVEEAGIVNIIIYDYVYGNNQHTYSFQVNVISNNAVQVKAVKLELGSVSTLAMDTAPNYQQELAKCQRYFQRIGKNGSGPSGKTMAVGPAFDPSNVWMPFYLPVPLRATPTVTRVGRFLVTPSGAGSAVADTDNTLNLNVISFGETDTSLINIECVDSNNPYTVGEVYKLCTPIVASPSYLDLSADL